MAGRPATADARPGEAGVAEPDENADFESSIEDEEEFRPRPTARTFNVPSEVPESESVVEREGGSAPSAPSGQACTQIDREDNPDHHEMEQGQIPKKLQNIGLRVLLLDSLVILISLRARLSRLPRKAKMKMSLKMLNKTRAVNQAKAWWNSLGPRPFPRGHLHVLAW